MSSPRREPHRQPRRRGVNPSAALEGVSIAFDSLRSNKLRSALTVLGVVIGVATVMLMAALIGGIRSSITGDLAAMGPRNFVISRWDMTAIRLVGDGSEPSWWRNPPITLREIDQVAALPSIQTVTASVDAQAEARYGRERLEGVMIAGRDANWTNYDRGDLLAGRNFLPVDVQRSAPVVVLSPAVAEALFGGQNPIGRPVRIDGTQFTVIGTYRFAENLFSAAMPNYAIVPHTTALKHLDADEEDLSVLVVPAETADPVDAMDAAMVTLRTLRGLRPGEENNFALTRQQAFAEMFDRITGVFFLVMIALSSIGLMVGGIGVVAVMMISVTERTREIGVRKALGATRREILWQFLVEAVTVTTVGGLIGMLLGGGGALLVSLVTPIPASVPLWSVVAALGVSALTGIGFGLYPASRAARLDPVEALRYE